MPEEQARRQAQHEQIMKPLLPKWQSIADKQCQGSNSGYREIAPDLAGYPAVFTSVSDSRSTGTCAVYGGVRKDELITVSSLNSIGSPLGSDPSPVVQRAAEAAIATTQGLRD
jgi:hypothetical protein